MARQVWEERVWEVWTLTPWIPSNLVADPLSRGDRAFMCVLDRVTAAMDFREPYIDRLKVILVKDYLEGSGEGEGLAARLLLLVGGCQVPEHCLETIHCQVGKDVLAGGMLAVAEF